MLHKLMAELRELGTAVDVDSAKRIIMTANKTIASSKQSYGFIGSNWKPLCVSDYWVYQAKIDAQKYLNKTQ